jgi:DNA-binding IclR family transcriptional regulator
VTSVLDAVATRPERAFGLAELSATTGISKATCLGIINGLCEAGYLTRDQAAKTYRLGPALLTLGAAAQASHATVELARPHLARLASQYGGVCTAAAVIDDQITVLARVGDQDRTAAGVVAGQRYPFAPPSGVMFVAWSDDDAVNRWLAREPLTATPTDVDALRAVVASCRARGYLIELLGELNAGLYSVLAELSDETIPERYTALLRRLLNPTTTPNYLTRAIEDRRYYDVSLVCAPVFDPDGQQDLLLAVFLMRQHVPGGDLKAVVRALTDATRAVTQARGGREPVFGKEPS